MPSTTLTTAAATTLLMLLAAGVPTEESATLRSSDESGADNFGASVAINARRVIVGAPGDTDSVGSALIFRVTNTAQPPLEDTLLPSDAPDGSEFGASVDLDAAYAVIGAPSDDEEANDAGAAYIFKRSGSDWSQVSKLFHPMPAADDLFGTSVAIDAKFAVVGAPNDGGLQPNAGSAHFFVRRGSSWEYASSISSGVASSQFGASVAIDADRVIIGAPTEGGTGAAYIYRKRRNNQWELEDQLVAKVRTPDDFFGGSVAIDGKYAIVGAPGDDELEDGAGAVYFFERGPGGQWALVDKRSLGTATVGALGTSVALSGKAAIAGAPEFLVDGPDSGAAFPFRRGSDSDWPQFTNALRPGSPGDDFRFGQSVALDKDIAAIAAPGDHAVIIFR